jgi:hypothetical protein
MTALSVARRDICTGARFIARVFEADNKDKNVISPKVLKKNNFVPDALEHNEYWYLDKAKCKVYLCEIDEFDYALELAWSCISAEQVRNMIKGYGERYWIPSLERYKSSEACYNAYIRMAEHRGWWSVVDRLWDDLTELPWAQTVKITDFDFKILKQLK